MQHDKRDQEFKCCAATCERRRRGLDTCLEGRCNRGEYCGTELKSTIEHCSHCTCHRGWCCGKDGDAGEMVNKRISEWLSGSLRGGKHEGRSCSAKQESREYDGPVAARVVCKGEEDCSGRDED